MKKTPIGIIVLSTTIILTLTYFSHVFEINEEVIIPPTGMTPEETVKYHFEGLNNKNQAQADSVVADKEKGAIYDLWKLNSFQILECYELKDKPLDPIPSGRIPFEYIDYAIVDVEVIVDYKFGGGGGLGNGEHKLNFTLIKQNEDSDWLIAMFGMGFYC